MINFQFAARRKEIYRNEKYISVAFDVRLKLLNMHVPGAGTCDEIHRTFANPPSDLCTSSLIDYFERASL